VRSSNSVALKPQNHYGHSGAGCGCYGGAGGADGAKAAGLSCLPCDMAPPPAEAQAAPSALRDEAQLCCAGSEPAPSEAHHYWDP